MVEAVDELGTLLRCGVPSPQPEVGPFARDAFPEGLDTIRLNTSEDCTLRCTYCYTGRPGTSVRRTSGRMEGSRIRQAIDFFVEHLIDEAPEYTIGFGLTGEPLLRLDDFDLIQNYAEKRGLERGRRIRCIIGSTNGTLLSDEVHDHLTALSPVREWPAISFDGPEWIHDAMRCFPDGSGSYGYIESRVKRWLAKDNASASATLTGTHPYVTDIFLHLFELGFRSILIKPVRTRPGRDFAIDARSIARVKEEYTRFVHFLLEQPPSDLLCYLSALSDRDFFGRFLIRLLLGTRILYRCPAGKTDVSVDAEGDIYPCDSFIGIEEFRLGNVCTRMDEDKRRGFLALRVDEKHTCTSCWARYLCGGGCYYSGWLATGRMDTPDSIKCDLIRHLITVGMFLLSEVRARDADLLNAYISGLAALPPPSAPPIADCLYTEHAISSDERAKGWRRARAFRLDDRSQFRGPKIWRGRKDLSATVRSAWDRTRFYLMAEVVDDVFCPPPTITRIDQGDSVQFALALEQKRVGGHRQPHDMYEYVIGIVHDRPLCIRLTAPLGEPTGIVRDPDLSIVRNKRRTIYRMAIPWSDMPALRPEPGRTYRFTLAVNERDDPRQSRAWMEWTPGLVVERDPGCFGRLRLVSKREGREES